MDHPFLRAYFYASYWYFGFFGWGEKRHQGIIQISANAGPFPHRAGNDRG
jgi:hypothetical protein